MNVQEAIACLKANGYRISKPKKLKSDLCMEKIVAHQKLNAVGKPYGENYDPNYRMKYKPRKYAPGGGRVGEGISPKQWAMMCKLAAAQWGQFMKGVC